MIQQSDSVFQNTSLDFRRLYIFGAGGSGREIAWLAKQAWGAAVEIIFLVDDSRYLVDQVHDHPVQLLKDVKSSSEARYLVALGDPELRQKIAENCNSKGHLPAVLIHPRAEISQWVKVGEGTVICANCIITCDVTIGNHVQINVGCTISHDSVVGDYSTLSPGVHVPGNVRIGESVFMGTNTSFINGKPDRPLIIGDGAVIAAGACVTKDVPPGVLVAGVPAVIKQQLTE